MRLTIGEGWWLTRRRLAQTQAEMSGRCGVSEDRYRAWEQDALPADIRPLGLGGPLSVGEYSALARRRSGMGLDELARRCRRSRQTLIKMERDRTSSARDLAEWWEGRGYPEPIGTAPLSIAAPPELGRRATRIVQAASGERAARSGRPRRRGR